MATTTNYGWATPDDTALVKDGAAAIRTLGTSVDTTTKNLNPSTTLGDIEYRSSTANVNTRLGIGSTGQVLTVTGGVPTWAAGPSGGGMTLLSTTTFSGSSITISSINQTYTNLQLVIKNCLASGSYFNNRIKPNGDTTACTYSGTEKIGTNTPIFVAGSGTNESFINAYNQAMASSDADNIQIYDIYNYASTSSYKIIQASIHFLNNIGSQTTGFYTIAYRSNSAISSIVIDSSAGNTFNAGTALLYGVK